MCKVKIVIFGMITCLFFVMVSPTYSENTGKIDINKAKLEELMTLEGVGETYANRIIEYREKNVPFKSPEEILNVKGIGKKLFDANRERIIIQKGKS